MGKIRIKAFDETSVEDKAKLKAKREAKKAEKMVQKMNCAYHKAKKPILKQMAACLLKKYRL